MDEFFEPGMLVQLNPFKTKNPMFAGCILVVTEVKHWGVQGYVQSLGDKGKPGGQAYYRAEWDTFDRVGHAMWIAEYEEN